MCTLTWETSPSGYDLHFNRDESRAREPAIPPIIQFRENTKIICPRDPEGGGTWISVNEHGVSLCLLNNYLAATSYKGKLSRGLLVDALSHAANLSEFESALARLDYRDYSPFDLFVFSPDEEVQRFGWDGEQYQHVQPTERFMSSSAFDTVAVIAARRKAYLQSKQDSISSPQAFHRSYGQERSAYSVCMQRPDAKTLSYSNISVSRDSVTFIYTDGSPCDAQALDPITIDRVGGDNVDKYLYKNSR